MGERNNAGADLRSADGQHSNQGGDNIDRLRQELHERPSTERVEAKAAGKAEGDLAKIPAAVRDDMDKSENFVLKELDRFSKLMPGDADPRTVPALETQDQVDARFASINWTDYDKQRRTMGDRTDAQKQQLSEFDRSMLDLMEQQALLKNYPGIALLGDGLTRNAGKYRDLLQTFNKDLQTIGKQCQVRDGHFTIE